MIKFLRIQTIRKLDDMNLLVKEPKTKRGLNTLHRICNSARILFYEKGYHNTSINDITDGAKIAPGTFYLYFNDKYNLYKYLLLQYSHDIRNSIRVATKDCKTRYEIEKIGLKTFLEYISSHKNAYHIIWESLYIDYELFKTYYVDFGMRYAKGLIEAQKTKEVRDIDPAVLSFLLMGVSNFIGLNYVIFKDSKPFDSVVDQVMDILENGMFEKK